MKHRHNGDSKEGWGKLKKRIRTLAPAVIVAAVLAEVVDGVVAAADVQLLPAEDDANASSAERIGGYSLEEKEAALNALMFELAGPALAEREPELEFTPEGWNVHYPPSEPEPEPEPDLGFALEGSPVPLLLDGVFAPSGEWDGWPLYTSTVSGSDAALYWCRMKDQWVFDCRYSSLTEEQKKKLGKGCAFFHLSGGGEVPVGVQAWFCNVDGKWKDRPLTVRALTSADERAAYEWECEPLEPELEPQLSFSQMSQLARRAGRAKRQGKEGRLTITVFECKNLKNMDGRSQTKGSEKQDGWGKKNDFHGLKMLDRILTNAGFHTEKCDFMYTQEGRTLLIISWSRSARVLC